MKPGLCNRVHDIKVVFGLDISSGAAIRRRSFRSSLWGISKMGGFPPDSSRETLQVSPHSSFLPGGETSRMPKPGLKGRLGHASKHGGSPAGSRGRTFAPLRPWEGSRYPAARMASYGIAAVFRPPKKEYSRISSNKYKSVSREGCKNPSLHKSREIRRRRVNETKA